MQRIPTISQPFCFLVASSVGFGVLISDAVSFSVYALDIVIVSINGFLFILLLLLPDTLLVDTIYLPLAIP